LYRFLDIKTDILKLDKKIIEKLVTDSDTIDLLKTIIELAHKK
jgi:EAL domain-containing protein (putative c-di-GMP-specific phosphodiesterase class I)